MRKRSFSDKLHTDCVILTTKDNQEDKQEFTMNREEDINKEKVKVYVIGHKNPDTDSICSAIAYSDLKNRTGEGCTDYICLLYTSDAADE